MEQKSGNAEGIVIRAKCSVPLLPECLPAWFWSGLSGTGDWRLETGQWSPALPEAPARKLDHSVLDF